MVKLKDFAGLKTKYMDFTYESVYFVKMFNRYWQLNVTVKSLKELEDMAKVLGIPKKRIKSGATGVWFVHKGVQFHAHK